MKKSLGFTQMIADGTKTIESRWYSSKRAPWDKIRKGDIIYFKDTGSPIRLQAEVSGVEQFEKLKPPEIQRILNKFGKRIGLSSDYLPIFYEQVKDKKYCILIKLKNPNEVTPFEINKKGFGNMTAWISLEDVRKIKIGI